MLQRLIRGSNNTFFDAGRRRSERLIDSPWLYKWPKRNAVYIDSDESERNINIEGGAEQNAIENRNGVGGRCPVADYFDFKNQVRVGTSKCKCRMKRGGQRIRYSGRILPGK